MPRPDSKRARPGSARAPRRGGPGTLQLALGGTVAACALFAGILLAAWLWHRPPPDAESRGTAFRVGRDGLWLTAGHVVAACRATPEIVLPSGRLQQAPVKRVDAAANLALLDTGTQDEPLALRLGQAAARRDVAHAVGIARAGPVGLASVYVVTAPRAIDEPGQEALRGV
ncbi:MAG: trypsin-like peptidase domain-containing protein, partial [Alphaproteobacteria bacterium]|nr:trypsin-like peptidase domain-containing protein [Alphaproteobacteria bacterium]